MYEVLFREVFASGRTVTHEDIRSYCQTRYYRCGAQLDGALELLSNIGIVIPASDCLRVDETFLRDVRDQDVGPAFSRQLLRQLAESGELHEFFPVRSLSWGSAGNELNIHTSYIPLKFVAVLTLLRDFGILRESEETPAIAVARPPVSLALQDLLRARFRRSRKRSPLSPERLQSIQAAHALQGATAEEYVLELERRRLEGHARIELVHRISLLDTAAGYDIESFEELRSVLPDRFVEVKSYKERERFFLSEGELEAARELGDMYYLYLVDIGKIGTADYAPKMIRNPAVMLFGSDSDWIVMPAEFEVRNKYHFLVESANAQP